MGWNVASIKKQHSKWLGQYEASLRATMKAIGNDARSQAAANPKLKVRTKAYQRGWRSHFSETPDVMHAVLAGHVAHNLYHEVGTGIYGPKHHRIYPKHARFLRWVDPDTGQVRFARSVRGVRPTWCGKKSSISAWNNGKRQLRREAIRLAAKF